MRERDTIEVTLRSTLQRLNSLAQSRPTERGDLGVEITAVWVLGCLMGWHAAAGDKEITGQTKEKKYKVEEKKNRRKEESWIASQWTGLEQARPRTARNFSVCTETPPHKRYKHRYSRVVHKAAEQVED